MQYAPSPRSARCAGPPWTTARKSSQWDKDDCAEAELVKFDLLGLGAYRLRLARWAQQGQGRRRDGENLPVRPSWGLHLCPKRTRPSYRLLTAADTVRSSRSSRVPGRTLLTDWTFYDIVVEVALIRRPHPGRRRQPLHPPQAGARGGHLPA